MPSASSNWTSSRECTSMRQRRPVGVWSARKVAVTPNTSPTSRASDAAYSSSPHVRQMPDLVQFPSPTK
jgi:hypothetical protein